MPIDPRHGRFVPQGRALARLLRAVFARQLAEMLGAVRAGARPASLHRWDSVIADHARPLLAQHWLDGGRTAAKEIRAALKRRGKGDESRGQGGGPSVRQHCGDIFVVGDRHRGSVHDYQPSDYPSSQKANLTMAGIRLLRSPAVAGGAKANAPEASGSGPAVPPTFGVTFDFDVFAPQAQTSIQQMALAFAQSTNATSTRRLDEAYRDLRVELSTGLGRGEAVANLTRRVRAIFADPARARAIAQTEASRAMHAGQVEAAKQSRAVGGKKWLASSDACPLCLALDGKEVGLDENFAVDGTGRYAAIFSPPRHPHCQCAQQLVVI